MIWKKCRALRIYRSASSFIGAGQPAMWHQWVRKDNDKEVVELLPKGYTRPWPGYLDFILSHDELVRICHSPEANREWVP